ncbi:MAG TPA: metallophosphoesterase [Candidatus Nanoarchaeia archaeon]|nr:metallophosphoesterase [Candidatus Nanoarchaeia archaeon]
MLQEVIEDKKRIIVNFLERGFLLSPGFFEVFNESYFLMVMDVLGKLKSKPLVLNEDLFLIIKDNELKEEINWTEFDRSRVLLERGFGNKNYFLFLDIMNYNMSEEKRKIMEEVFNEEPFSEKEIRREGEEDGDNLIVLQSYKDEDKKREVGDFVKYYRLRYNALRGFLMNRGELKEAVAINRVLNKSEKGVVAIIGIVKDKRETKNGNIMLVMEDLSGEINVIVNKSRGELYEMGKDIVLDEVIGITGVNGERIIFANTILLPEIPLSNELKKLDKEKYIVFTSDLHIGSKMFFQENFIKFINWLNYESGNEEQKKTARKVGYLFLVGDLVEGGGIYPGQEDDLVIKDIYEQYKLLGELLRKIRKDLKIVIIGGNHDALRLSEPQPPLDKRMVKELYEMGNVYLLTNPCMVNICASGEFQGFNVLMYHGGSFPYFAENVESIRKAGRLDRADLIMRFLLQRRHLAPSHGSTLYIPDVERDPLVIERVPDFFVSGHIHKTQALNYRGVTMLGCGCWTGQTEDQEKRGIIPDPNRVTLVNLNTREVKILNFGD